MNEKYTTYIRTTHKTCRRRPNLGAGGRASVDGGERAGRVGGAGARYEGIERMQAAAPLPLFSPFEQKKIENIHTTSISRPTHDPCTTHDTPARRDGRPLRVQPPLGLPARRQRVLRARGPGPDAARDCGAVPGLWGGDAGGWVGGVCGLCVNVYIRCDGVGNGGGVISFVCIVTDPHTHNKMLNTHTGALPRRSQRGFLPGLHRQGAAQPLQVFVYLDV